MRRVENRQAKGLGHRPFKSLDRVVGTRPDKPAPLKIRVKRGAATEDDAELFLREVGDVVRLDEQARQRVATPAPVDPNRPLADEEAEALTELCELVAGRSSFDITDTDAYIEAAVVGLDHRLVRKLRNGEFVTQAHLDLHGMSAEEARAAVDRFLSESYRAGRRCILIVHGKGRNSKDQIPVLKTRLKTWLARGQWSRLVLAFTSARSCDGGTGAIYVLLRRERASKRTIRVTEGAKR